MGAIAAESVGPVAQASPSSRGSRRESWPTPSALDGQRPDETPEQWAKRNAEKKAANPNLGTLHRPLMVAVQQWKTPMAWDHWMTNNPRKDGGQQQLPNQVQQWATPKASDPQHSGPNMRDSAGNYALPAQAVREQWATPRSGKTTDENPETWAKRQAQGNVATMPLTAQVQAWRTPSVAEEKNQNTSKQIYLQNQVGAVQKRWPTPASSTGQGGAHGLGGGSGANATLKTIGMAAMGTGKLNPRWVETLMGLPVGWTMPSCASPVTIAQTSCVSSATESSQPPQNELFGS